MLELLVSAKEADVSARWGNRPEMQKKSGARVNQGVRRKLYMNDFKK
jgi:hypothetical protein